jgi:uncharacterized RDD family membrane protein YckC
VPVDDRIGVITPEVVEFTFDLPGLASRVFALIVDQIIQGVIIIIVIIAVMLFLAPIDEEAFFSLSLIILLIARFIFEWGYFIFFELLWDGRSPGKKIMGCRVIRDGGMPVNFTASLIRNFIRPIDYFLTSLIIGFFIVFASPTYKRLGDLAAGTVVVTERRMTLVELLTDRRVGAFRPSQTPHGLFTKADVSKLTQLQLNTIRRFLDRRYDLSPEMRMRFTSELFAKVAEVVPSVLGHGIREEQVLEEIIVAMTEEEGEAEETMNYG